MKTLLLIRHAKSDWDDPSLRDFDRPLNERGKQDAPRMARRLLDKKIAVDAFISSPAKRARKTAEFFAKAFGREKEDILFFESLYLAPAPVFFEVINGISDDYDCIAVFSHNDGITDFANMLTDARIDNIPTCGIFAIKSDTKTWKDFDGSGNHFYFFDYPKSGG
ncbi:MAG: histidine phosphatase family protein [Chitinophagaceae bacterium]